MANMNMGDRNALERATVGTESLMRTRNGSSRGTTIFFMVAMVILAALSYAAIKAIHGWDHIFVILDLIVFTAAIAVFVRGRREQQQTPAASGESEGWRPTKGI